MPFCKRHPGEGLRPSPGRGKNTSFQLVNLESRVDMCATQFIVLNVTRHKNLFYVALCAALNITTRVHSANNRRIDQSQHRKVDYRESDAYGDFMME